MLRPCDIPVALTPHDQLPRKPPSLSLSVMAAPSTEQRELQLVETVEFKILAVANKEEKLHLLLQRFLAPLILKAASDHAPVRARVSLPLLAYRRFSSMVNTF